MCLGEASMLSEISLDGNPFASDPNYKQSVLSVMHQLKQCDMKWVSVSVPSHSSVEEEETLFTNTMTL